MQTRSMVQVPAIVAVRPQLGESPERVKHWEEPENGQQE